MTHASAPTSTTTVYVHDLNDHIIAELNALGQTQREYIWLDDMPVAVVDNVASGNPVIYAWSNPANIDLRFPGQWFQL